MLDKSKKSAGQDAPVVIKKYANRRLYNTESSTYVTLEDLAQMVRADRDFVVYDAKSGDDLTHSVLTQIIVEQEGRAGGPTLLSTPFLRQLIRFYDDSMGNLVPGYLQFSLEALTREQEAYRKKLAGAWGTSGLEAYQEHARNNMKIFEQAMAMWTPFQAPAPADGPSADTPKAGANDDAANKSTAPAVSTPEGQRESHAGKTRYGGNGAASVASTNDNNAEEKTKAAAGGSKEQNQDDSASSSPAQAPGNEIDALKAELAAMQQRIEKLSQQQ